LLIKTPIIIVYATVVFMTTSSVFYLFFKMPSKNWGVHYTRVNTGNGLPWSLQHPSWEEAMVYLAEVFHQGHHQEQNYKVKTNMKLAMHPSVCIIMFVVLAWKTKAISLLLNLKVIYSISWIQLSMLNSRFCLFSLWIIVLSSFATKHSFGSFSFLKQKLKH